MPIPTRPVPSMMKCVADEEPTTNSGTFPKAFGLTDSSAHGVDVPIPNLLFVSSQ